MIAIDSEGDLVVGVSTSGYAYKHPGRVGDSPLVGKPVACRGPFVLRLNTPRKYQSLLSVRLIPTTCLSRFRSPLCFFQGSGFYADNEAGSAAATGDGDKIMRFCPSLRVVELLRDGLSPTEACKSVRLKRDSPPPFLFLPSFPNLY
jgi:N4-(beta-N-acetylglucosaminyl)-L-asparaginase